MINGKLEDGCPWKKKTQELCIDGRDEECATFLQCSSQRQGYGAFYRASLKPLKLQVSRKYLKIMRAPTESSESNQILSGLLYYY